MIYPKHIAIIPDGNRTRSKKNGLSVFDGYLRSVDVAIEHIKYIFDNTDIKILSGRGMSTDNLKKRPVEETNYLFEMYKICGNSLFDYMKTNKINFHWIGNPKGISQDFLDYLIKTKQNLTFDTDRYVIFALNYSGRDEIIRGIQNYAISNQENLNQDINSIYNLTEEDLGKYMDLGSLPNVEMVIRTKGSTSSRTSGFMSRWIGYAELYFTDKLYQELDNEEIARSLIRFDKISQFRNFGG